jgi:hypothetical protein
MKAENSKKMAAGFMTLAVLAVFSAQAAASLPESLSGASSRWNLADGGK